MPKEMDFGIAWEWEYDRAFIRILDGKCRERGILTCVVDPANCEEITRKVLSDELTFTVFFDRASDTNDAFIPLSERLVRNRTFFINHPAEVKRAINKAAMHLEFAARGIKVPYTIILPVYEKDPTEQIIKLENVGIPFIIKPAHGGGGLGVQVGAKSVSEIVEARRDFRNDQILIQENIIPRTIGGRRAWFRTYYIGGVITSCWWDPYIHIYERLSPEEISQWGLQELERMALTIHGISKLNFFSTEVALTEKMDFVSVDYVNDQCDMRLKSVAREAVPDDVVHFVCESLASFAERILKDGKSEPDI